MTFSGLCTRLNRAPVYVRGLQRRFALPMFDGAAYTESYRCFLETVIHLRILGVPEDSLVHLWTLERKLMQLLHADSTGSPTWFLDACGSTGNRDHRLLLSNFDIGAFLPKPEPSPPRSLRLRGGDALPPTVLQLGLNFAGKTTPELFTSPEMGEDAIAILRQYLVLHQEITIAPASEIPVVRAALHHFPPPRRAFPPRRKPRPRPKPLGATLIPGEI